MSAIVSLSDFKLAFNVSGTADDALISNYISGASDFVERQCAVRFSTASYTDTFDGDGSRAYAMGHGPVVSILSVSIGGDPVLPRTDLTSSGFVQDGPILRLTDDLTFDVGLMNCSVTYTAGIHPVPMDVQQAVLELAGLKYRERRTLGLGSVSTAGTSITVLPSQIPISVQRVIDSYRRCWF